MPPLIRQLALAWMFLWLPISGVMASTLPFCAQGIGGLMARVADSAAQTQNLADAMQAADSHASDMQAALPPCHAGMPIPDNGTDSDDLTPSLPGEHCSLCHLAGALALPAMPLLPQVAASAPRQVTTVSRFHSWQTEPLQPPPLFAPA